MPRSFTEKEVEKLIEQAYLNGVAEAGRSQVVYRSTSCAKDFKESTAYYEFCKMKSTNDT